MINIEINIHLQLMNNKDWKNKLLVRLNRQSIAAIMAQPLAIALGVAVVFMLRFANCLPFSDSTRIFNYETASTLASYLIYSNEPFTFPLGAIKGLTYPFNDANIGNVGAIPLFAIVFKCLCKIFPFFKTFDYFVLVEILSCFWTAYFAQKTLMMLGVNRVVLRFLGALLTGTSFLLMTRSGWLQPFCVVSFPLFMAWVHAMLLTLQRGVWNVKQDTLIVFLFPIAALTDNYTLVGILMATSALLVRELFEAYFGGRASSWNRASRILFFCLAGTILSILALYLIGMFPLPSIPNSYSSYDFGMGGRYHTADLFGPWIPVANTVFNFPEPSLLAQLGFPLNTDKLGPGQYEGVAYIGTPLLLLSIFLALGWIVCKVKSMSLRQAAVKHNPSRLVLYSPWKKVGLGIVAVFVFSLGYELHVFGFAFPNFSGMPAAWISDRITSFYNIRATGRLASLLSMFIILESIRVLNAVVQQQRLFDKIRNPIASPKGVIVVVSILVMVHLAEIAPFLRPVGAQPSHPVGGVFSQEEIEKLQHLASHYDKVL
ncbi:MAG: hypothetical protein WCL27_12305, partial [Betaproteobacteria bacterium]